MVMIAHIAIWTHNPERLKAFYETYFEAKAGPKYTNRNSHFESYFLSFETGARLEIMQMPTIPNSMNDPQAQATGLIHVAISVGSEAAVDALVERLQRDHYFICEEPRRTGDGYYESVIFDPDGNRIEITV